MLDKKKQEALESFIQLYKLTASILEMDDYLIPESPINNLVQIIKSNDITKIEKYINATKKYIENLRTT